jgi:acyl dehydratase
MALDPSFKGRTYPATEPYLVSREKIREFARAIRTADPVHYDPVAAVACGYLDVIAPPTFAVVVTTLANRPLIEDPELGLDFSRVVHGDERFAFTRPVLAGDRLVCVSTVEDVMSRGGHDFLTIRTDLSTDAGELVVSVWSRLVVRGD